jgi:hypothetical protein
MLQRPNVHSRPTFVAPAVATTQHKTAIGCAVDNSGNGATIKSICQGLGVSIDAFFAQNPDLLDDLEATEAEASTEEFLAEADQISFHAMS